MPALEVLALDTVTPRIRAPATGDTYTAPRAIALAPETLTGAAATTSFDITQTWNTTGTPTALKLNVTDTASNAASRLAAFQVGGVDQMFLTKAGTLAVTGNLSAMPGGGLQLVNSGTNPNDNRGFIATTFGGLNLVTMGSSWRLAWESGSVVNTSSMDLILARDAANTLAQRNGINAQTFNLYNTYTDASNYERGFVRWNSNRFEIGADALGTGTRRTTTLYNRSKLGVYDASIDLRMEVDAGSSSKTLSFQHAGGAYVQFGIDGTMFGNFHSGGLNIGIQHLGFSVGPGNGADASFVKAANGVIRVADGGAGHGALQFGEQTAPAAPPTNSVRLYAVDNGSGKTQLMALFATGASQQIAIEP